MCVKVSTLLMRLIYTNFTKAFDTLNYIVLSPRDRRNNTCAHFLWNLKDNNLLYKFIGKVQSFFQVHIARTNVFQRYSVTVKCNKAQRLLEEIVKIHKP